MTKSIKIAVGVALIAAVGVVLALKTRPAPASRTETAATDPAASRPAAALPRLLDLGSVTCVPCKMMTPVLEDLKKEFAGKLQVEFIDVKQDGRAGARYGIRIIPTQVFFDSDGVELFRHEGFFAKADILAKWKELGVDLEAAQAAER